MMRDGRRTGWAARAERWALGVALASFLATAHGGEHTEAAVLLPLRP